MTEVWKDIAGYEGMYQVSNLGRVKSLARVITRVNRYGAFGMKVPEKILRQFKRKNGYYKVNMYVDKVGHSYDVHRLVAAAFVPNPDHLLEVNHKDECKQNNRADNLEWCTRVYNVNYGTGRERLVAKITKRPVAMFTMDGQLLRTFISVKEAERFLGIPKSSRNITIVCQGKEFSRYGYRWSYVIDGKPQQPTPPKTDEEKAATCLLKSQNSGRNRAVEQLTPSGQLIATYRSIIEAQRMTGIPHTTIRIRACGISKATTPYRWRFKQ